MAPTHRDTELHALAAAVTHDGDRGAFDELAAALRPRLIALLRQRLRDDATVQDVLQQTLLRWWEKRDAYDTTRPFVPWLMTLAVRLAVDAQRRNARRKHHEDAVAESSTHAAAHHETPALRLQQREDHDHVWALVRDAVNAETAEALWLFYGEGMNAGEIADVLNKRSGAIRVLLHRGREALRQPLRNAGLGFAPAAGTNQGHADPSATKSLTPVGASS